MEWRVEYLPRWYYQDGLPGETKPSYAPYLGQLSARLEEARPAKTRVLVVCASAHSLTPCHANPGSRYRCANRS